MPDIFPPAKRSEIMSRIRGKGNAQTEFRLIQIFRAHKLTGWRRHSPLPGRPDFVFPQQKLAVFVDGCFWHGCPEHFRAPKSNRAFWKAKIARNSARDREVGRLLRQRGWKVCRVWAHALRDGARVSARIRRRLEACG